MPTTETIPTFTISGHVFDTFNAPISGVKIQAYDKDLRNEQPLGKATVTDSAGLYSITFNSLEAAAAELKTPDVFIRVFDNIGKPLGQSQIVFNISFPAVIDFKVGNTEIKPLNEFDSLVKILQPLVTAAKLQFKDLTEKEPLHDISFLAGETGEDTTHIDFLVKAYQLADAANKSLTPANLPPATNAPVVINISPAFFYALLRDGFPSSLNELLHTQSESLRNSFLQSIEENIISGKLAASIDGVLTAFNQLLAKIVVEGDDTNSEAFKKTVSPALPTPELQKVFLKEYIANESTPEKFWENLALRPGFTDGKAITATKSILQLSVFTGNQPELTTKLYNEQKQDSELKDLRGFAKYDKEKWKEMIVSSGVTNFPEGITGATAEEKIELYAASLDNLVQTLYPTDVFMQRLKTDTSTHWGNKKADMVRFLTNNSGFDLKTNKINKLLETANFDGVSNKESLESELKKVNRLYKLSTDFSQINALKEEGVGSATDIVLKFSKPAFIEKFASVFDSMENSKSFYERAKQVNMKATAILANYKLTQDIPLYVMRTVSDGSDVMRTMGDVSDDYKELFGATGLCDCEHCQSVYSAAAYFVDLLKFIKDSNTEAFKILTETERRPDLLQIELSCENTNSPLPYIDLVNEILENKVAGTTDVFQTEGDAAELSASPAHTNAKAYKMLTEISDNSVISFYLPFDLFLEEIRLYIDKLGHKRHELMELLYSKKEPGIYKDVIIAAELLKFSPFELAIISGATSVTVNIPAQVDLFLQKTGISYIELLQLLGTTFLNPKDETGERLIAIVSTNLNQPATCNLNELIIQGVDDLWMNKMIRFVRLWKKLGWDIFDLDRIFTACSIADFPETVAEFNNKVLLPLSHILRIGQQLNLPVRLIITFWADIDKEYQYIDYTIEGQPQIPSLYQQLFRNRAVTNPLDEAFDDPNHFSGLVLEHSSTLTAALGIAQPDLELLAGPEILSLDSISVLYRYVILSKALRVSIVDLLSITGITGMQPFDGLEQSEATIEFIDALKDIRSFGFSIAELNYLLRHLNSPAFAVPAIEQIALSLYEIREGLKKIRNESTNEDYETKAGLFVADKLGSVMYTDAPITSLLLTKVLLAPGNDASDKLITTFIADDFVNSTDAESIDKAIEIIDDFPALAKGWILLYKTTYLLNKLKLKEEEIDWLYTNSEQLGIAALWNLPYDIDHPVSLTQIENLLYLQQLRKVDANVSFKWFDIIDIALKNGADAKKNFIERFAEAYIVNETSLVFLLGDKEEITDQGILNAGFPHDYFDGKFLLNVLSCCKTADKLGNNTEEVAALIKEEVTDTDAQAAKNMLKARYSNEEWLNIIKPISDQLRVRRRDALVAFLLAIPDNGWANSNAIFETLLIDVEMDACMMTSRIKQAISSVQLFIDRCLIGLETGISLDEDFSKQWRTWRERYRVWEANRKIFLYPENWIEPELRDDKTPFFKELESKLLQNEVTQETAEDALREYLEKLDEVARLEIAGIYQEEFDETDETKLKNIVHVFGRTKDIPHKYFYRKQINPINETGAWTPWERVELDIEGDHIIPVVWNKRLMLFWATFTEKQDNNENFQVPAAHETIIASPKYWEAKMTFSEYKQGRWTAKKIRKEIMKKWDYDPQETFIRVVSDFGLIQFKFYQIYIRYVGNEQYQYLNIEQGFFEEQQYTAVPINITARMITGNGVPLHIPEDGDDPVIHRHPPNLYHFSSPPGTFFKTMKIIENGSQSLVLTKKSVIEYRFTSSHEIRPDKKDNLLNKTPGIFTITPQVIEKKTFSIEPFAYEDANGVFLVTSTANIIEQSDNEVNTLELQKHYKFHSLYFPFADKLARILNTEGIDGLYKKNLQNLADEIVFTDLGYGPNPSIVEQPYPIKNYDFSAEGSYSIYNWELFFHIPLLIATRLSQNQKFEEASQWFHYIFNPTIPSNGDGAERFWITKPFIEEIRRGVLNISEILNKEHNPDLQEEINNWANNPFKPHAVARMRVAAYMRAVVMKYVDNLIAWGDNLFRQDTLETINEATLLYVLASNILGKYPEKIPPRAIPELYSFATLPEIDPFGNVKAEIESFILPSVPSDSPGANLDMPLFCIPKNDYLLSYWDTVADRLFKIRHCQNIEGIFRQLPLFELPLDPGLLVRAAAAGVDIASVVGQGTLSLPNYRFNVMLSKANELCNDVKILGNALLSALEKKDAEQLSFIRSGHELGILQAMRDIKQKQRDEAEQNLESLNKSRETIEFRKEYYFSRESKNQYEKAYLKSLTFAEASQDLASASELLANTVLHTQDITTGAWSWGFTYGGSHFGAAAKSIASGFGFLANYFTTEGAKANALGSYQRRDEEWKYQGQSANLELKQLDKQILAAEIRFALAERDLEIHEQQIENAKEVDDFMRDKFTNQELYNWMVGQIATVYFQSYQLAFDTAKKAEKCFQYELGIENGSFIQFGYWDSLKKGLLSGEKLQYDLRRLENAYLEQNKREFELTKHVSISQLNPTALLQLKETGSCELDLPEALFDLDYPGHYFRRIKCVSLSIPCIAGPYTSVNCTLILDHSSIRNSKELIDSKYQRTDTDDTPDIRFTDQFISNQFISTSHAQNDSGMFELNFRDERYLPFEGLGAISKWKIELNGKYKKSDESIIDLSQFDFNTLSDVILHLKYTAKEGGPELKKQAVTELMDALNIFIEDIYHTKGLFSILDVRHEFSNEWHRFISAVETDNDINLELSISKDRLPFFAANKNVEVTEVTLFAKMKDVQDDDTIDSDPELNFDVNDPINLFKAVISNISTDITDYVFSLTMKKTDVAKLEELFLLLRYKLS